MDASCLHAVMLAVTCCPLFCIENLEMPGVQQYFCNCSKYCKSRKEVSRSVYYKHKAHRLANLPDTYHGPVNVPQTTSAPGVGSFSTAAKWQRQELEDDSESTGNGTMHIVENRSRGCC